ncbi:hypothetical protein DL744_01685 [Shigella dysenteriae]|nr:hypothetical protein [Shigella dysenteriae]EGE2237828.1 hypothetical protein [Shigella dysenteriae]OOO98242.1 hypothetical protein AJR21_005650 [Shigella dysenteriae]RIF22525.1 hypothetical protein UQ90_08340 [Shigella dysenteriae]RIF49813.1 hypothetical protein UL76_01575 [Shigella dysenteriae]
MYQWLNAQLKRSGICAIAFRLATSRPSYVEWRGVIASVHTVERHTQTVVCFICGAKHCAIFYG